jgi:hypothetical protein
VPSGAKLPAIEVPTPPEPSAKNAYCPLRRDSCPVGLPAQLLTVVLMMSKVSSSKAKPLTELVLLALMSGVLAGAAGTVAGGVYTALVLV